MCYLRLASSIGPPYRCTTYSTKQLHMCQSQEKIEHYSVPYFDCITMFEAQRRISDKGRTDMRCVDTWITDSSLQHILSSGRNESSVLQPFKHQRTNTGQVPACSKEPVDFTDTKLCKLQLVWRQQGKKRQISPSDYWSNWTGLCSAMPLSVQISYCYENILRIREGLGASYWC